MRRIAGLLALAAGPVLVLGVLFVLPVSGMLAEGFVVDGRFAPGRGARGARPPAGAPGRVVHRVDLGHGDAAGGRPRACRRRTPCTGSRCPGGPRCARRCWCRSCCRPSWSGVAFRQLLGEGGPLGFLGLDGTPFAIVCGLVFFNVAVVVRTVGVAWESLDPRPGQAAAALGASPSQVLRTVTLPALRPAIVGAASIVFLFCATAFGIVLTLGGVRHATVETEIYLLTTTVFDLQAAAALSVLQIVVVVGLLALAARLRATPDPTAQRAVTPVRAVRRGDAPVVVATLLVLARDAPADPHPGGRLAQRRRRVGAGQLPRPTTAGDNQALLVPGDDGARHQPPHRRRRDVDGAAGGRAGLASSSPAARTRSPSVACARPSTASSCCRSG